METWQSGPGSNDKTTAGLSSLRQSIKSVFKSKTSPTGSDSTQDDINPTPQKVFWPQDYLTQDILQARVWTYGYNADVVGFFKANSKNSISQHGRDLQVRLEREIEKEVI